MAGVVRACMGTVSIHERLGRAGKPRDPWCENRDSNPDAFRHEILSLARLPNSAILARGEDRPIGLLPSMCYAIAEGLETATVAGVFSRGVPSFVPCAPPGNTIAPAGASPSIDRAARFTASLTESKVAST